MSPRFVLGRENMSCVAEVVNRSLKADCTDFTLHKFELSDEPYKSPYPREIQSSDRFYRQCTDHHDLRHNL